MVFALVCSMIPAALATEGTTGGDNTTDPPTTPTVENVTVSGGNSVAVGKTLQLTATVTGENSPAQTVTWSSSDAAKATVDANGLVTGMAVGDSITITATSTVDTTKSGTVTISVTEKAVESISIPSTATLNVGETITLSVTYTPADATNREVTWTSSDASVATVSEAGVVTALKSGSTTLTATSKSGSKTATCTVTVKPAVESVTIIDKSTTVISKGQTLQLSATISPAETGKTITWSSSAPAVATVDQNGLVSAKTAGWTTITAKAGNKEDTLNISVSEYITIVPSASKVSAGKSITLAATINDQNARNSTINWYVSNSGVVGTTSTYAYITPSTSSSGSSVYLVGQAKGNVVVTAYYYYNGQTYTATCPITVEGASVTAAATVYTNTPFSMTETNEGTATSVADQINSQISQMNGISTNRYLSTVVFNAPNTSYGTFSSPNVTYSYNSYFGTSYNDLSYATFTANANVQDGAQTAITFVATDNQGATYSGVLNLTIRQLTGAAILYTASIGESVDVDLNDFYTFWNEATNSRGTLQSVKINSVSTGTVGGVLCANHSAGERTHNSASGRTYYISPTSYGQTALSSLTFFPGTNSRYKTGSVTISFTATGTNYYTTGSSTRTTSYNGTITILYTNGEVQSIDYPASTGVTMLNASDFDAVYQQATGTTTRNPSYTIKFLDVPTYGTLYANYGTNNRGQVTGTEITSKNLNTLSFSNRTTGTNAISKVGYVPGYRGVGDSIRYAVYSGSTLQYVGTINFGVGKMEIKYACGASGVAFKASDFFSTSGSLLTSQYITFGTPSSGTLYKGGSARVTSADKFGYSASVSAGVQAISSVTYVPAAGFNGTVEIPFTSVTYTGGKLTGTVKITVTTKTFTDVPATHWAYAYVSRLVAEGVVSGTTPTTYSPGADVKYGEALKMILIAAGYPAQSEGSGANWASNYLTLAYNNGIVSSKNVDLNKAVDRNTIAEIAAKALKLGSASRINTGIIAPTDSTNGYVYALYNAGIVAGDSSSGRNCYYGSRSITRAEVAKVICNVSDYYSSHK